MSTNDYARGFTDALEYVLGLFNRLNSKKKEHAPPNPCENCSFVEEIGQLMILAKDKQFEKIERELGYFLH